MSWFEDLRQKDETDYEFGRVMQWQIKVLRKKWKNVKKENMEEE